MYEELRHELTLSSTLILDQMDSKLCYPIKLNCHAVVHSHFNFLLLDRFSTVLPALWASVSPPIISHVVCGIKVSDRCK